MTDRISDLIMFTILILSTIYMTIGGIIGVRMIGMTMAIHHSFHELVNQNNPLYYEQHPEEKEFMSNIIIALYLRCLFKYIFFGIPYYIAFKYREYRRERYKRKLMKDLERNLNAKIYEFNQDNE